MKGTKHGTRWPQFKRLLAFNQHNHQLLRVTMSRWTRQGQQHLQSNQKQAYLKTPNNELRKPTRGESQVDHLPYTGLTPLLLACLLLARNARHLKGTQQPRMSRPTSKPRPFLLFTRQNRLVSQPSMSLAMVLRSLPEGKFRESNRSFYSAPDKLLFSQQRQSGPIVQSYNR